MAQYSFKKSSYFFIGESRLELSEIRIGSEVKLKVKDKRNRIIIIPFQVTRNACLGKNSRWVYGRILDAPEGEHYQIEIKLHKEDPAQDTIEVFPHAPQLF